MEILREIIGFSKKREQFMHFKTIPVGILIHATKMPSLGGRR